MVAPDTHSRIGGPCPTAATKEKVFRINRDRRPVRFGRFGCCDVIAVPVPACLLQVNRPWPGAHGTGSRLLTNLERLSSDP
jgi:hypothetical protein